MGILDRLMGKKDAGAGRGFVNPKTVAEMNDEERSPAEREARQMMKDRKAAKEAEAAYEKAMPAPYAKGGMTKKYMSFTDSGKPDGMKTVKKMASGGMTASKRADGIAQRGKTRGKMC